MRDAIELAVGGHLEVLIDVFVADAEGERAAPAYLFVVNYLADADGARIDDGVVMRAVQFQYNLEQVSLRKMFYYNIVGNVAGVNGKVGMWVLKCSEERFTDGWQRLALTLVTVQRMVNVGVH